MSVVFLRPLYRKQEKKILSKSYFHSQQYINPILKHGDKHDDKVNVYDDKLDDIHDDKQDDKLNK